MIRKGSIFVRAKDETGRWGAADVLDLDDESFRAFVLDRLEHRGMVVPVQPQLAGEAVEYRTRVGFRFPADEKKR